MEQRNKMHLRLAEDITMLILDLINSKELMSSKLQSKNTIRFVVGIPTTVLWCNTANSSLTISVKNENNE